MKITLLIAALAIGVCPPAGAAIYDYSFNGINAAIPDGNLNGISDTRVLSGMSGSTPTPQIANITVSLNISGGYNGDLYAYLVHGNGFVVLLNRVGRSASDSLGYDNAGFAVTFSSFAANDIHAYQSVAHSFNGNGQLTGAWQADGRNVDPVNALDTDARTAGFSSFNGLDPNGAWTLFLVDAVGGEQSQLASWQLEISTVPEPIQWALGIFIACLLGAKAFQKLWRRGYFKTLRRLHYFWFEQHIVGSAHNFPEAAGHRKSR